RADRAAGPGARSRWRRRRARAQRSRITCAADQRRRRQARRCHLRAQREARIPHGRSRGAAARQWGWQRRAAGTDGTVGIVKVRIVCATRAARDAFPSATALGKTLSVHRPMDVELRLFTDNTAGLPSVYNIAIEESAEDPAILLFIHDDVHLCDFHWTATLNDALGQFGIVGAAGNRRRIPRQPGWRFLDERFTRDGRENLSGTLHAKALRFDEQFDFHFYDLDLCRQAERAGVSMGTCAVSLIHESKGNFGGDDWRRGYEHYLAKWGD